MDLNYGGLASWHKPYDGYSPEDQQTRNAFRDFIMNDPERSHYASRFGLIGMPNCVAKNESKTFSRTHTEIRFSVSHVFVIQLRL